MKNLKEMKIWICWKYEINDNGKETKIPYSAYGKKTGTSKNYENTWVNYATAEQAQKIYNYDGIGFIIPSGYFFLDIDGQDINTPFVKKIMQLVDSYAEISPSGKGIHIIGRCDLSKIPVSDRKSSKGNVIGKKLSDKYYAKNPHNHTELYIGSLTNRYATYTGNIVSNKEVTELTYEILAYLNTYMLKNSCNQNNDTEDAQVLDIICNLRKDKNGEKFVRLFDKGDITGYESPSNADEALCSIIAFRAGSNPSLIDAVFRCSKLYRDKWEREDYRSMTIQKAIEVCNGNFHHSVMDTPEFITYNEKKGYIVLCPALARYIRNHLNYFMVRDSGTGGMLIYVYEKGCYKIYAPNMFMGIIKGFITRYNEDILRMSYVSETYNHLTTDLTYKNSDELNADENIINFQNGILNLQNMSLIPHSPNILSTIQLPCQWLGYETPIPIFDNFMKTLTNGDKDIEKLLLQFMGVCLSNVKGYRMKKALFMVGNGDTGKSQLKSLTEMLLGRGNYIGIDLKEIESRFGTGNIYGKRLAGSSDMSFMSVDELKTFKNCTGGDSLFAEFKGQNGFEFTYNGLLWFCMNKLPKFGGDDGKWVYDRIIEVDCNNIIPKEKQDKFLLDKMYTERDGIIYKAIMALIEVIQNGYNYTEPLSVINARLKYRAENNSVISFFNECMEKRADDKITDNCTTSKIYKVYRSWCNYNNNGYSKTSKDFRNTLAEYLNADYSDITVRRKDGIYYRSYTLTKSAKDEYSNIYGFDEILV